MIKLKNAISLCTQQSHPLQQKSLWCFGSAVIDTACARTVCGQQLDSYITGLSERELNEVKKTETHSHRPFRFGDGKVIYSTKKLKILATTGVTECHIETDVVPADIPLLLSKATMKRAGTVLDMKNDRAVMFNKPVKLDFKSSGHYCVRIVNNKNRRIQYDELGFDNYRKWYFIRKERWA